MVAVASLVLSKGAEVFFSPFVYPRGGDMMHVTLSELLLLLAFIVALLDLVFNHINKRK